MEYSEKHITQFYVVDNVLHKDVPLKASYGSYNGHASVKQNMFLPYFNSIACLL